MACVSVALPEGPPIECDRFRKHFLKALKTLGIRERGPYSLKDCYISLALTAGVNVHWLESQTGVRFETMRRHYGRYMRSEGENELAKLTKTSGQVVQTSV